MPHSLADRFRRLFEFERFAHARVFASLDGVPADRRDGAEFRRAVDIMGHVVLARRIWLSRLGSGPAPTGKLFPENANLEDVRADWAETERRSLAYLATLKEDDLDRIVDYKTTDGTPHRDTVEDLLTQLSGHSPYHRGQIAMLVRASGGTSAATDFIHWLRSSPPG
ncbi:DinB family protein [Paludisphaera mucosa]|uniref:DinB family protein n=1 Tax=Paludisphaera mucosa TaxID=3030827 RepID=A0ABT6F7U9_9BACT|nr:DinB family protein [Paludisphaera mucosa]MDG3003635.1 DinB family protein [Paludisphaera mucosa]